jgi:alanine transaminase
MRPLTLDSVNPQLLTVQYAVRGELVIKADVLREQLKTPGHGLPFDKVISSNIGNPQ